MENKTAEKIWGYWLDQPGGTWITLPKLPLTRAGFTQPLGCLAA